MRVRVGLILETMRRCLSHEEGRTFFIGKVTIAFVAYRPKSESLGTVGFVTWLAFKHLALC